MASEQNEGIQRISPHTFTRTGQRSPQGTDQVEFQFLYSVDVEEFAQQSLELAVAGWQPISSGAFKTAADGSTQGAWIIFRRVVSSAGL